VPVVYKYNVGLPKSRNNYKQILHFHSYLSDRWRLLHGAGKIHLIVQYCNKGTKVYKPAVDICVLRSLRRIQCLLHQVIHPPVDVGCWRWLPSNLCYHGNQRCAAPVAAAKAASILNTRVNRVLYRIHRYQYYVGLEYSYRMFM